MYKKEKHNMLYRACPCYKCNPKCCKFIFYKNVSSKMHADNVGTMCKSCYYNKKTDDHYKNKNYHNFYRLFDGSLESCYWIGFIMADGCFPSRGGFVLGVSRKDYNHLMKFVNYISYTHTINESVNKNANQENSYRIYINGPKVMIENFKQEFGLKCVKTYDPPTIEKISKFTEDQICSLIAGFIDGDGCITQHNNFITISITNHISWGYVLSYFGDIIGKYNIKDNDKYTTLYITSVYHIKRFVNKILTYNLPLMRRKWDKINLNYICRDELLIDRHNTFVDLYLKGFTYREIAAEMQLDIITVYRYGREYRKSELILDVFDLPIDRYLNAKN